MKDWKKWLFIFTVAVSAGVLFGCDKLSNCAYKPFGEIQNWGGGPEANWIPINVQYK